MVKKMTFSIIMSIMAVTSIGHALEVGEAAPCVVLPGLSASGQSTEGCIRESLDPNKEFTVLELSSIYCSACQKNLPRLAYLNRVISRYATTRLVTVDSDMEAVRAYLRSPAVRRYIQFPVAFDSMQQAARAYEIVATPTIFVLQKLSETQYKVAYKHTGVLQYRDVVVIARLVAGQGTGTGGGSGGGCGNGGCGGGCGSSNP